MEMVRHIVVTVILCLGLLIVICPTTGIGLTLDDELQELTENYVMHLLDISISFEREID